MDRYPVLIKLIAGCAFILLESRVNAAEPEKAKPKATIENVGNGVNTVLKGFFGEVPSVEKLQGEWKLEISVKLTKPPEQGPAPKVVEAKPPVAPPIAPPVALTPTPFVPPPSVPLQVCPPAQPEKPSMADKLKNLFKPKPTQRVASSGLKFGFQTYQGGLTRPSPQYIERAPQYFPPVDNAPPPPLPPQALPISPATAPPIAPTPPAPLQRGAKEFKPSEGWPDRYTHQVRSTVVANYEPSSSIGTATGASNGAAVGGTPIIVPRPVTPLAR